ncbi:MAG: NTP pyrophosphohydrolases including oxidative damage repair enzymes, partial [uncultured Blastococcus sp.]
DLRPPALRRRPVRHLRPGAGRAARRCQAHPLDVVRLPAGRRPGPQRHGAALRDLGPGGGAGLPVPPDARPAAGGVRPRAHRAGHRRPRAGLRAGGRDEAALLDDAVRARRPGRAGVPRDPRPLVPGHRGRGDDRPAL